MTTLHRLIPAAELCTLLGEVLKHFEFISVMFSYPHLRCVQLSCQTYLVPGYEMRTIKLPNNLRYYLLLAITPVALDRFGEG
ncbi:hypothetical protein J1614_009508 [Plenodomus biglobosus]|nr:hypothetical protein J1614_009508 [Plenodomus biglobosus]